MRKGIVKAGFPAGAATGVVITTGGNDLMHTLTLGRGLVITKIMAYNPLVANVTLQFGTLNRAVAPAFVALLPILVAIAGLDNEWTEEEIPAVEWVSWPQATAAGRTGDVYVLAGAATVTVQIEVKEIGG